MPDRVRLPMVDTFESSLAPDGRRRFVHTADVHGKFTRARRIVFAVLIAIWIALPLIPIGGHAAVLLDVARRRFYLFGQTFNAQDVWLMFFILTGAVFVLAVMTAVAGRVFCGFACPQTVFLDMVFRPIERFVDGPREERRRRQQGPWNVGRLARLLAKHALYLLAAFLVAHVFLSFFVPLRQTLQMVLGKPSDHPEAFAWATAVTLLLYGDFAWFREQLCLVVCPYGRLQASLIDADSLVIGYDSKRGEPRGKAGHATGDCVDCKRCVVVCPTGIDIRNGQQLDCVGCTACIDACDEIMLKLKRPTGLVRFDSQVAFAGGQRRIWRPRLLIYAGLGVVGLTVATLAFSRRESFEANITRPKGAPFVVEDGRVRNSFVVHLVNKRDEEAVLDLETAPATGVDVSVEGRVAVPALGSVAVPCVVTIDASRQGKVYVLLRVLREGRGEEKDVTVEIVRPVS